MLNIESTSSFYQNMFGNETSLGVNPALLAVFPNLNTIGIDFSGFEGGGGLTTDNGSWFVTPDDAQGAAVGGEVIIGQFTVAGGSGVVADDFISATVSVQGTVGGSLYNGVGLNAIPAPGALALLGVAGLVSRRRRK